MVFVEDDLFSTTGLSLGFNFSAISSHRLNGVMDTTDEGLIDVGELAELSGSSNMHLWYLEKANKRGYCISFTLLLYNEEYLHVEIVMARVVCMKHELLGAVGPGIK